MKSDQFRVLSQETVFAGRIFNVLSEQLVLPNGKQATREFVSHPGAVVILPRAKDGRLLMIKQYRHAIRETILEFPAGTLEAGENPLECAKREIIEETGHAAADWTDLGTLVPGPGFCNEVQYCFLADGLSEAVQNLDEDEVIEVVPLPPGEIEHAISQSKIKDAKSIAIYARAKFLGLL